MVNGGVLVGTRLTLKYGDRDHLVRAERKKEGEIDR